MQVEERLSIGTLIRLRGTIADIKSQIELNGEVIFAPNSNREKDFDYLSINVLNNKGTKWTNGNGQNIPVALSKKDYDLLTQYDTLLLSRIENKDNPNLREHSQELKSFSKNSKYKKLNKLLELYKIEAEHDFPHVALKINLVRTLKEYKRNPIHHRKQIINRVRSFNKLIKQHSDKRLRIKGDLLIFQ